METNMTPALAQAGEPITANTWIEAASASIRAYCGWHIAPSLTHTLILDSNGTSTLMLPTMHVTNIEKVEVCGIDVTEKVEWSETGMLRLMDGKGFPDRFRAIKVTLTHGYGFDEVPDVLALVTQIAQRAAASASTPSNLSTQSVNGASVGYLSAGGAHLSTPLLNIEKDALSRYRVTGRVIAP